MPNPTPMREKLRIEHPLPRSWAIGVLYPVGITGRSPPARRSPIGRRITSSGRRFLEPDHRRIRSTWSAEGAEHGNRPHIVVRRPRADRAPGSVWRAGPALASGGGVGMGRPAGWAMRRRRAQVAYSRRGEPPIRTGARCEHDDRSGTSLACCNLDHPCPSRSRVDGRMLERLVCRSASRTSTEKASPVWWSSTATNTRRLAAHRSSRTSMASFSPDARVDPRVCAAQRLNACRCAPRSSSRPDFMAGVCPTTDSAIGI